MPQALKDLKGQIGADIGGVTDKGHMANLLNCPFVEPENRLMLSPATALRK